MKLTFINVATVLTCLFLSLFSTAGVIYDESINGDLDAVGSTNVNLVAGENLILGSIEATPPADTDRIKFTQMDGLIIDSIELSFSGVFDDANIGQSMNTALFNSVANLFDDNFNSVNSGSTISASFFDSFGPETGVLSQNTAGAIWDFQLSAGIVWPAQPWVLRINTSSLPSSDIPEPASLTLLSLGLLGLASRRYRKK